MTVRRHSLRRRLLTVLVASSAAIWATAAVVTWSDAHRTIDALLDAQLAQAARLLVAQAAHESGEAEFEADDDDLRDLGELAPYGQKVALQVWARDGRLVLRSSNAPTTRFSDAARGFADVRRGNTRWRVFVAADRSEGVSVQLAEDHAVRDRLAARIAFDATMPLLLSLPLLALAIGLAVPRLMRPLERIGQELSRRDPAALVPIPDHGVPEEVAPLLDRLNDLFARVQRALERERRFTANAAHELRNPLAALRAQAEVARRGGDPARTAAALDQVIAACDRLTRLVSQLLALARVEEQGAARSRCRLDAVARRAVADLAPDALAAGKDVGFVAGPEGDVIVEGNEALLEALLRNLIDNALRHGGEGVRVTVTLSALPGPGVRLDVADDGAGVDAEALRRLGTPFERPAGTGGEGSGLGLALVRRIAEWHGGTLAIGSGADGRGLRATVCFPAPSADSARRPGRA